MHWKKFTAGKPSSWVHDEYRFHDLLDDDESLLGFVRESVTNREFVAHANNNHSSPLGKTDNLDEAKAMLIAHLVKERLDDL